jgi:hypothetical protein
MDFEISELSPDQYIGGSCHAERREESAFSALGTNDDTSM